MWLNLPKRQCLPMCAGEEASLDRWGVDASVQKNIDIQADGPFGPLSYQNDNCTGQCEQCLSIDKRGMGEGIDYQDYLAAHFSVSQVD